MSCMQTEEKVGFRLQFVIWTLCRCDGIVRCCKEVQAMHMTSHKQNSHSRKTAVSLGVISAMRQFNFYEGGVK